MMSLYDHPDLCDLPDSAHKDRATLTHWETVFKGRKIRSALDVSIGTVGLTLEIAKIGIKLAYVKNEDASRSLHEMDVLVRDGGME